VIGGNSEVLFRVVLVERNLGVRVFYLNFRIFKIVPPLSITVRTLPFSPRRGFDDFRKKFSFSLEKFPLLPNLTPPPTTVHQRVASGVEDY
jgi:hypothetical protein